MPRPKEFNEQEVLEKATLLFWQKGYHNTSIKDLIGFLGISNASIYNAFGGKRQLFDLALNHYRSNNIDGMSKFLHSQKDVRKGLRAVFEKIITDDQADVDCKGCFIVNTTTEMIPEDAQIQMLMMKHRDQIEGHFSKFLQMGVETGQIDESKDLSIISRLLYTYMSGLRVVSKSRPKLEKSLATVDEILTLLT